VNVLFLGGPWHQRFRDVAQERRYADHPYRLPECVKVAGDPVELGPDAWLHGEPIGSTVRLVVAYRLRLVAPPVRDLPVGVAYVADYAGPALYSDPRATTEVFDHSPAGG
jgi:hypothetical protein